MERSLIATVFVAAGWVVFWLALFTAPWWAQQAWSEWRLYRRWRQEREL